MSSGYCAVPWSSECAGTDWRWDGDWLDCTDVAGDAVVHPVQCDRWSDGDSFRSEGGCHAVPLHDAAEVEDGDPAGNFSVFDYGTGDGIGRRLERQHYRGILSPEEPDAADDGAGSGDKRSYR